MTSNLSEPTWLPVYILVMIKDLLSHSYRVFDRQSIINFLCCNSDVTNSLNHFVTLLIEHFVSLVQIESMKLYPNFVQIEI